MFSTLKECLKRALGWRCNCGAVNSDAVHDHCQFCGRHR
jgi:hypothetical protein